jgi:hypothetical protein
MKLIAPALGFVLFAAAAWAADDNPGQRNVYELFSKLLKPAVDATVDEQATGIIKRHMAKLLYPVDLSSFARPEKDGNFRNHIMVLQKQMGEAPTGTLTSDQFDKLAKAASDIEAPEIGLPPFKTVSKVSNVVVAQGTVAGDKLAHKFNHTRIECLRADGICNLVSATFDPDTLFLWLDITQTYTIKVWTADTVIAVQEGPCGVETLTITVSTEMVALSSTGSCGDKTPTTFNLVGGFPIAWKTYQEKRNKARMLVYEPARRLVPIVPDSNP